MGTDGMMYNKSWDGVEYSQTGTIWVEQTQ